MAFAVDRGESQALMTRPWAAASGAGPAHRLGEPVSPRDADPADLAQKILEIVGLEGEAKGYSHLAPDELAALREVISRKAAAFWIEGTARSVMRGFKHDVLTTGLPVRGRPIRLKGSEAEFVRDPERPRVLEFVDGPFCNFN